MKCSTKWSGDLPYCINEATFPAWLVAQLLLVCAFLVSKRVVKRRAGKCDPNSDSESDGEKARKARSTTICKALSRKSFHVLGGTLIAGVYYYGLKYDLFDSAYLFSPIRSAGKASFVSVLGPLVVFTWLLDFSRQVIPALNRIFMSLAGPLVRERELAEATGMSFFLPGALCAAMAFPPEVAIISIVFLTVGDAAAGLGTAAGKVPLFGTKRKLEGTIGCFLVCALVGLIVITGLTIRQHVLLCLFAAAWFAWSELWAEVIRFDDNLFLPVVGGLGLQYLVSWPAFAL